MAVPFIVEDEEEDAASLPDRYLSPTDRELEHARAIADLFSQEAPPPPPPVPGHRRTTMEIGDIEVMPGQQPPSPPLSDEQRARVNAYISGLMPQVASGAQSAIAQMQPPSGPAPTVQPMKARPAPSGGTALPATPAPRVEAPPPSSAPTPMTALPPQSPAMAPTSGYAAPQTGGAATSPQATAKGIQAHPTVAPESPSATRQELSPELRGYDASVIQNDAVRSYIQRRLDAARAQDDLMWRRRSPLRFLAGLFQGFGGRTPQFQRDVNERRVLGDIGREQAQAGREAAIAQRSAQEAARESRFQRSLEQRTDAANATRKLAEAQLAATQQRNAQQDDPTSMQDLALAELALLPESAPLRLEFDEARVRSLDRGAAKELYDRLTSGRAASNRGTRAPGSGGGQGQSRAEIIDILTRRDVARQQQMNPGWTPERLAQYESEQRILNSNLDDTRLAQRLAAEGGVGVSVERTREGREATAPILTQAQIDENAEQLADRLAKHSEARSTIRRLNESLSNASPGMIQAALAARLAPSAATRLVPGLQELISDVQSIVASRIHEFAGSAQTATEISNILAAMAAGRFNSPESFLRQMRRLQELTEGLDRDIRARASDQVVREYDRRRQRESGGGGVVAIRRNGQTIRVQRTPAVDQAISQGLVEEVR